MARARGSNRKISFKKSVELAAAISGKKASFVLTYLEKVIEKKQAIPYRRFKAEMGHKRGARVAVGGYPVHVAQEFTKLIVSAQKNAKEAELSGDLYILSASARQGEGRYRMGRHSGRQMKSTHIEVVVGAKKRK